MVKHGSVHGSVRSKRFQCAEDQFVSVATTKRISGEEMAGFSSSTTKKAASAEELASAVELLLKEVKSVCSLIIHTEQRSFMFPFKF